MKIKFLCLIFLLLQLVHSTNACINEYRTTLGGMLILEENEVVVPIGHWNSFNWPELSQRLHEADSVYKVSKSLEDYSDYAALLTYSSEFEKAKQIFLEIESKSPGRYQTAGNLGTIYELMGQNDSALYWIKKGVGLNPQSHEGSEWIHVKILEAKITANSDEKYFSKHNILGLDFGNDAEPINKKGIDPVELREHLFHQLNERMSFVQTKDPIIGQMLFELGNVTAIVYDVQSATGIFDKAREYGYSSELMDKREAYFKSLGKKAGVKNYLMGNGYLVMITSFAVILAVAIGGIYFFVSYFRRKAKQSRNKSIT
jgi:tetratricopeptide (TPR) repeat protein